MTASPLKKTPVMWPVIKLLRVQISLFLLRSVVTPNCPRDNDGNVWEKEEQLPIISSISAAAAKKFSPGRIIIIGNQCNQNTDVFKN